MRGGPRATGNPISEDSESGGSWEVSLPATNVGSNLRETAKAFGPTIPEKLLALADDVIE